MIFERLLRTSVPLAGTLSLELAVTFGSFIFWFGVGELQARHLILVKLVTAVVLVCANFRLVAARINHSLRFAGRPIFTAACILFLIGYVSIASVISYLSGARLENIFVALYVISSPIQGYIFSLCLDSLHVERTLTSGVLILIALPSLMFLGFAELFALERLILGSYAVGGLFAHFAILCLFLSRRDGIITSLLFFVVISLLCFEIYAGGSRRYMLPLAGLLLVLTVLQTNLTKIALGITAFFCCGIWLIYLNAVPVTVDLASQGDVLERGLGYRDAEFGFYLSHLTWERLLYGVQLGFQELNVDHGSKGITDVGPRLHNFYLTLLLNGGLLLLMIFVFFCVTKFAVSIFAMSFSARSVNRINILLLVFGVSWLISAWFDLPPDGLWPVGTALFWLSSNDELVSESDR